MSNYPVARSHGGSSSGAGLSAISEAMLVVCRMTHGPLCSCKDKVWDTNHLVKELELDDRLSMGTFRTIIDDLEDKVRQEACVCPETVLISKPTSLSIRFETVCEKGHPTEHKTGMIPIEYFEECAQDGSCSVRLFLVNLAKNDIENERVLHQPCQTICKDRLPCESDSAAIYWKRKCLMRFDTPEAETSDQTPLAEETSSIPSVLSPGQNSRLGSHRPPQADGPELLISWGAGPIGYPTTASGALDEASSVGGYTISTDEGIVDPDPPESHRRGGGRRNRSGAPPRSRRYYR